ncbi:Orotidine 5'-phosphate decarboxylase [hydrothermal vent metagenome]|uniref:Orotidine 5'-phosphate decarboxylase n=1 Tax=hydrothermal vent metagenome TaxID=652676 RepID=A0A3B0ZT39_9ZZZZ
MQNSESKIIVALDYSNEFDAISLVEQLDPKQCRLKVGKELFTSAGPALVKRFVDLRYDVFLDLKFHDIPNTVAKACAVAADLGVWMVNVHALGGRKMLEAARSAIDSTHSNTLLIGVTILTSMDEEDLLDVGLQSTAEANVLRLARLAQSAGLDGVVCSPLEIKTLRTELGADFLLVTPGVRPAGSVIGDQKRIMTPTEAISNGSSYLVIGRPITLADKPLSVLLTISREVCSIS